MKLQTKISIYFLISSIISTLIAYIIINLAVFFFDKSYSRMDVEKISLNILKEINSIQNLRDNEIIKILKIWEIQNDHLNFAYINEAGESIFSTFKDIDFNRKDFKSIESMKKRIAEEEKRINDKTNKKFFDHFDHRDFTSMKPVIFNNEMKGTIIVSVKKEFAPPFMIRINKEKRAFIYIIGFASIIIIIILSYIFVFLLTMPLINRLKLIFNKINNFELDKPDIRIYDSHSDEVAVISNTFNKMADKINDYYKERMKYYEERQELIKNISHDFRTPLTSILGYSASLDDGMYENIDEQKKYINIIRKKAAYMSELFDELLELSRFDNKTFVLKKTNFNIAELIREIIIEYIPELEKNNFYVDTDIPDSIIINADKDRISRAIRNIIENVLKHGYYGKYISISVNNENETIIQIIIKDKGKGIEPENIEKIFDRFYRTSQGGMGLGLSITKEIIEKHKGVINVESNIGEGSTFIIDLPK